MRPNNSGPCEICLFALFFCIQNAASLFLHSAAGTRLAAAVVSVIHKGKHRPPTKREAGTFDEVIQAETLEKPTLKGSLFTCVDKF